MNRKRILSLIMAFCMVLSLLPADVLAVEWPEVATRAQMPQRGTDAPQLVDGYYEIYNADQLYWFAQQVNSGNTGINGKLMADIVVNENVLNANGGLNGDSSNFRAWMPIGEERAKAYKGIFDGNGKTISGLYFNDSTKSNVGLFGYVEEYGKVLNVGVVGSWFSGYYYVGGVVGVNYGLVGNSYNTGSVSGSGNYIGGVVSFNSGSCAMVQNCYNTGSVSGSGNYVGGVVSINYGSCAMVQNCYNTGDVIGGGSWSGGVVGFNALFDSNSCGTISHCFNTGDVNGSICAGGVVGTNSGTVSNCYNVGSICGNSYIGGVVGYITNGTINNCFNDGNVSSSSFSVGGVAGYNYSSDAVINCYYLFGCAKDGSNKVQYGIGSSTQGNTTADISGETTGKITTQFTSGEVAFLLGEAFGQSIGTDTYPILFGAKVYRNQVGGCNASSYVFEYSNTQMTAMTTHNWAAATCHIPATCIDCGALGDSLEPVFVNGFCSICDGYEPAVLNGGVYEISNAGQLYWFAEQVNGGSTSINGKLMADIVVNENVLNADGTLKRGGSNFRGWTPIGSKTKEYAGIFDGNNHSISGMTVFNSQVGDAAMFKSIAAEGRIQNLKILDSYFGGSDYSSSAFAVNNSGVISNCINAGTVYRTDLAAGGIVCSNSGRIENCINLGSVGTFGFMSSSSGGIADSNSGTIVNCYNAASVEGYWTVGGLVAANYGTIINCYNTGYVEGVHEVGGVAGSNSGTIMNCYNIGSVFAHSNSDYYGDGCGGVAGFHRSGTISNCYYLIDCAKAGDGVIQNGVGKDVVDGSTADVSGRTTGMTAEQFASGEVAYLLQGDQTEQIWGQTIGTDAYPVLGGKKICKNSSTYYNCVGTWLAATCTTPKTCTVCGATMGTALGHSWKAATCTSPKSCTVCGLTEGDALGHDWDEATCTKPSTCTTCGATTGNALGHNWKAATCTKPKTCTVCGETSGSALGHKWTNATCTEPKTCTVCGATTGTALGHSWKAATCTSPKTCTVCGLTEGNPLGHKWSDATCTAPKTCTTCGTTSGKALGHIEVVIPGYAATYDAPGLTDGSFCSRCGDTLQEQAVIDPIPEEVSFSYKAYGINGSTNAVNSGYITVEIWMNVNSDFARVWGADIGLSFNQNLTLLDIQGGIFEEALATPLNIANAYNAVKMTQDMVLGDDKTFQQGQYLFATLTFKVDKNFHSQNAAFLVDVDECSLIRQGEFANELVTDFGTGTNIYISKLGDANRDGKISAADTMALSSWLQNADLDDYNAVFDLNKDGYIDGDDFALLRGAIVWDNGYLDI